MKMNEEKNGQTEYAAWENKEERIVTFREAEGYQCITFQSQEEKFAYVYHLCRSGYRIL